MSYYLFYLNEKFSFVDFYHCFYHFSYLSFFRLDKIILFFVFEFVAVEKFSTE